jgi:hypothetical protein
MDGFEYVFGQNATEHNPAPSPSGHPLLSGPLTLNDIHQIFTRLVSYVCMRPAPHASGEVAPTLAPRACCRCRDGLTKQQVHVA